MKLKTFLENSPAFYQSGKCIYLKSAPGRGKTSTVLAAVPYISERVGKNLGITIMSGPLLTPMDAQGYLVPTRADDGRVESVYTEPFWWRTTEGKRLEEYDGGIVFVDEMDKADLDVKKSIGEMALSGRMGPHRLPPGWVVWMAGNRSCDRSGSTRELDHLINRRFEIDITDDLEGFKDWCSANGVHYTIIAFAESNPHIVFPDSLPKEQGPFCTPRSLVATGEMLATLAGNSGDLPTHDDAIEIAAAGIGQAAAAQLFATIRLAQELPSVEEIVADPAGAPLPGAPDAQMLTCYRLAQLVEENTLGPIITYIERLPADFGVTFGKSLQRRNPRLLVKPAMIEWTKRHSGLVALMSTLK